MERRLITPDPVRGLRVAVTGGTSGLGLALVRELTARGATVALVARSEDRVREAAASTGAHGIVGDVSAKTDIHRIALQVLGLLGGLDVLVNNASSLGPVPLRPLADTDCEDFEAALAANLVGPFRLTKALLGALAGHGLVLNIGSDAGTTAYANWGAYGTSKAALAHMTRIWDQEVAEHGIRMACIDPGDMDTPMHALALPDADRAALARPEDAAHALCAMIETSVAREPAAAP